jgi:hypothetical protein
MVDNTLLNVVGVAGDTVRTLDKTGTGAPKTEVVTIDLGGGDGRAENILYFPIPVSLADIPQDDDAIPMISMSSSSMDNIEMLFRQLIATMKHG